MRYEILSVVLATAVIIWVNFGYLAIAEQPEELLAMIDHVIN